MSLNFERDQKVDEVEKARKSFLVRSPTKTKRKRIESEEKKVFFLETSRAELRSKNGKKSGTKKKPPRVKPKNLGIGSDM